MKRHHYLQLAVIALATFALNIVWNLQTNRTAAIVATPTASPLTDVTTATAFPVSVIANGPGPTQSHLDARASQISTPPRQTETEDSPLKAPSAPDAMGSGAKRKAHSLRHPGHYRAVSAPTISCGAARNPATILGCSIATLSIEERLKWADDEFAKREMSKRGMTNAIRTDQ